MVITSKYNGKCTACHERVLKGMQVNWVRGVKGVTHADCENPEEGMACEPEMVNFAKPVEPKKGTVTVSFDLTAMTVEQLKALASIVETEVSKRETVKEAA